MCKHAIVHTLELVAYEWDENKNRTNSRKHGVRFADAVTVFDDDNAMSVTDSDDPSGEERTITIGMDASGRITVVVYTTRGDNTRIISARPAQPHEREIYEGTR